MTLHYPPSPPLHNTASPRDKEPDESDWDKVRKWQEERLARKLRGEYESAVLHLSQLVNDNLSTPLRIASVRVEGAPKTRQSFLAWLIHPHLQATSADPSTSEQASNLGSVLHTTRSISRVLTETDIFHSLEAKIEKSRDALAGEDDVDVVFKARERGRFFMKTSTEMGNGEGNASLTARARNTFGGAETLEANISLGTTTRRAYQASLTAPLMPNLKTTGTLSLFGTDRDNTSFASSTEGLRGVKAAVRHQLAPSAHHELAYELVSRHLGSLTPSASLSTRLSAGTSLKSALSHTLVRDTRDDPVAGTRGWYTRLHHEFAGLGGDARFHKMEGEGQFSRRLFPGTWISFAARAGHIYRIGDTPSYFSDRFQLGGPLSVRSFRANSMGPRDGADSLGGEVHWSAGVSLISDIPRKPHWPVKTHLFVNAGKLDTPSASKPLKDCLANPSVSAGVGLIYRFDPVRVEVNFGVPLVASKSDGYRRGFQVGIGLDFL
ncbi:hypothetical protein HWV62_17926 [Athelia sp. TMB]|nr:hypothetical protein HWV62_17926 [Athelia sp. TMB]